MQIGAIGLGQMGSIRVSLADLWSAQWEAKSWRRRWQNKI
jgi:hypothetical protein